MFEKFMDIQRHHGPVTKLVDLAETYIKNNIHWKVEFDGSRERKETPEVPMDAVREALLNSFCHKNYRFVEHYWKVSGLNKSQKQR